MSRSVLSSRRLSRGRPSGMTLIEMLIATTITLIIMAAVAEVFGLFGAGVSDSRSVIEMTDQMRTAAYRLRQDLAGATAPTRPPLAPEQEQGYFEYIEGPATDANAAAGGLLDSADTSSLTADCDDIVLFTTRSVGSPFVGRFATGTIESPVAEVGWFCKRAPKQVPGGPTLYTLYRRQLLVLGYAGAGLFTVGNRLNPADASISGSWQNFYEQYDVSARLHASSGYVVPNTLGELTKRESRFLHAPVFPFIANITPSDPPVPSDPGYLETLAGSRFGEDVMLTNILSFDVRTFDPNAFVRVRPSVATPADAVAPGDPGYSATTTAQDVARGAYVDLNWASATAPTEFPLGSGATFPPSPPLPPSAFAGLGVGTLHGATVNLLGRATYDTWSTHYESDGIDQDGDCIEVDGNGNPADINGDGFIPGLDEGTNGFDDDGDGVIDEADEAETSAPYPVALRGIEIRIRCYEPSSRQIRQVTVRHTFVPH